MIKNIFGIFLAVSVATSCVDKDTFVTHNGNMPTAERVAKAKVGQTKQDIQTLLGDPSTIISLDQNTWMYMSADIEQFAFFRPKEISRDILKITFDKNDKVIDISHITKKNGKEVQVAEEKTNTLGHKPGFFQRFFGGVGQYRPFDSGSGGTQ